MYMLVYNWSLKYYNEDTWHQQRLKLIGHYNKLRWYR